MVGVGGVYRGCAACRLWNSDATFGSVSKKLRNTFRYLLGNIHDFDAARDAVAGGELAEIDQWVLIRAEDVVARSRIWYDEFAFDQVYRAVYDFATTDLSNIYFDVLKDRLYTSAAKSKARRSAQTALYRLAQGSAGAVAGAPILSFTTEEVWGHLGETGSVHTAYFPEPGDLTAGLGAEQRARMENWNKLLPLRDEVLKSLEAARQGRRLISGLRWKLPVRLSADDSLYPLLEE